MAITQNVDGGVQEDVSNRLHNEPLGFLSQAAAKLAKCSVSQLLCCFSVNFCSGLHWSDSTVRRKVFSHEGPAETERLETT